MAKRENPQTNRSQSNRLARAQRKSTLKPSAPRNSLGGRRASGSFIVRASARMCPARSRQCFGSFVLRGGGIDCAQTADAGDTLVIDVGEGTHIARFRNCSVR